MSRVAIVTGGGRGIGRAIVDALLGQGIVDHVHVWDLEPGRFETGCVSVCPCDVTDVESVTKAYAALDVPPKVLVNNAGGDPERGEALGEPSASDPFVDPELFRHTVELNFVSAHVVTSVVGPHLTQGASICTTASIAGQMPSRFHAYGASKAAVIHWTKGMALALSSRGVRVNAVAPGIIRTRIWERITPEQEDYERFVATRIPLGRDQAASEIADAVAFLSSERAAQITGQVLAIDGGMTLGQALPAGDQRK